MAFLSKDGMHELPKLQPLNPETTRGAGKVKKRNLPIQFLFKQELQQQLQQFDKRKTLQTCNW